jgi:hypothetical protein
MAVTKNPRGWKWFFAILALLTMAAIVGLIAYNESQQLRLEQFEAYHALWQKNKPASYTLAYEDKFTSQSGEMLKNEYLVEVRKGKVTEVLVNGIPKTERLEYHDMDALLGFIERFFELDQKEKRRVYRRGYFKDDTGALRWYVRRPMASVERQEITVKSLEVR